MLRASVWILLLTLIDKEVFDATGESVGINRVLYGRRWIHLGLYSGNVSHNLTVFKKPDDSLLCYNFTKGNSTTEQCKFYGDCCVDPMRIRDRLEPGTFSCQTTPGYTGELVYVVDKCPRLTQDKRLIASCEQMDIASDFSIETWPVTSRRTGVLYRNIFCAICHGVLAESNVTLQDVKYTQPVDFWWVTVNCDKETISKLTEGHDDEGFSMEKLEPYITHGACGVRFSPPSQPHRCLDAVRSCPDNFTDVELKLMCEQGPVSYTRGEDGVMYRNYFCQLCHGLEPQPLQQRGTDCGPEAHSGMNGSFKYPNLPSLYSNNDYCNWTITLPLGGVVGIRVDLLMQEEHCDYDYLKFYDLTTGAHMKTLCGSGMRYVKGNSSSVQVVFRTDGFAGYSGFTLRWAALSCEFMGNRCSESGCETGSFVRPDLPCDVGTQETCCEADGMEPQPLQQMIDCGPEAHTGMHGTLSSPNYPNDYPNNAYCNWTITLPLGGRIGIRLNFLDIEGEDNCPHDHLEFYDLTTLTHLDTLCGTGVRYVEGNSSSVIVVFSTDDSRAYSGFELEWAAFSCQFMGYTCSDGGCELGSDEISDLPCDGGTRETCCAWNGNINSDVVDCGPEAHTGLNGTLTSPNYPNNYPNNAYCNWTITLPLGGMIGIRLNFLDIEGEDNDCPYDYVEFYDLATLTHLETFCGSGVRYVEGKSSSVLVVFSTDEYEAYSGFELEWAASSCEFMGYTCSDGGCELGSDEISELPCDGGTRETCCAWNGLEPRPLQQRIDCGPEAHTGMNGTLSSPNYPNNYPNNAYCNWTITLPLGGVVGIRLNNLDIEEYFNCVYDYLKFYDLTTGAHLKTLCGSGMRYVKGSSSSVQVVFRTDEVEAHSGFSLQWAALSCEFMGNRCSESGCETGSFERPDLPCDVGTQETCCEVDGMEPQPLQQRIDCGPEAHTGMNGTLSSPNYPNNSPNNAYCNWTITLPLGGVVGIRVDILMPEEHWNLCVYDYLEFYDLTTGAHLKTLCGSGMIYVKGRSSSVQVVFRTDEVEAYSGFTLQWAALSCEFMGNRCSESGCETGSFERPDLPCDVGTQETCCEVDDQTKKDVPHSATTGKVQGPIENSKWPYPFINIQPKLQSSDRGNLSPQDYVINTNPYASCRLRLALTNNLSEDYEYSYKPFYPPTNSSWDFGSLLCESLYKGVCDKLISRPSTGCAGPGCGVNSWQDTKTNCYDSSDFTYNASVREQAEYIWPHSLYGRYSSFCNQAPNKLFQGVNCRCDSRCHYFGECCLDTPLPANFILPHEPLKYKCVGPPQCYKQYHEQYGSIPKYHVAIISTCPTGSDTDITQLCRQGEIGDWNPEGWTVYDSDTKLSYKNMYCARCNNVPPDRVKFWQAYFDCPITSTQKTNLTGKDDMYRHEWQGECSFIRFIPRSPDILYTCLYQPVVSTCPHHLESWKIADDCKNKPVSWVTNDGILYRNAFCAICNLNDGIMSSDGFDTLLAIETFNGGATKLYYDQLSYRPRGSLVLDVSENLCCYGSACVQNTFSFSEQSPWGKIELGNSSEHLATLPFNTTYRDKHLSSQHSKVLSINFLCSRYFDPVPPKYMGGCMGVGAGCCGLPPPGPSPQIPSFAKLIFTNFHDIPSTQTLKHDTKWLKVDDSLLMCSNGSNLDPVSGVHYATLGLSPSTMEVKQQKMVTLMTQTSLEVYDYILISLSLLSLSIYIIYILIRRRQRALNTPELLKLSVLISLFGALLCYSVANIPAGRDMIGCQALAALLQFLFLSTLTWTSAMGINIAHVITKTQPASNTARSYLLYAIYAFGLPTTLVMTTYILSVHQESIKQFESPVYREDGFCFIRETYIIYSLFLAPIYMIVTSNVILCIVCIVKVGKTTGMSIHDKDRGKKNVITCIKLSVCFGLGWSLALLLPFFDDEETNQLFVAFQVFVEIQGLLVVATNLVSWKCIRDNQKRLALMTSTSSSGPMSIELSNRSDPRPHATAI